MKTFRDNAGRGWCVSITVAAIKRVRSLTGVDLLDLANGGVIERLARDPVLLVDVLYAACEPQARKAGVTDEAFGESLAGDAIANATDALMEELISFSPSPSERQALGRVWGAVKQLRTEVDRRIEDLTSPEAIEALLAGARREISGEASTGSPASSGSTPTP